MAVAREDRPIGRLFQSLQLTGPDALVETIATAVAGIGGRDVVLYLIDYEHAVLLPYSDGSLTDENARTPAIDGSMAGRAFSSATVMAVPRERGWQVWLPVSERANSLGVLTLTVPDWDAELEYLLVEVGTAVAYLLQTSAQYTDRPHMVRRRKDMDLAAEMQWALLPPLSFSSPGVSLSGLLEPAYSVGGDCFDYAFNGSQLDIAVFDAMGHGLTSAVMASLVVGAYRHGRRSGEDLPQLVASIDAAVRTFPRQPVFATGLLGRLDVDTGQLAWMAGGHPQPIIVRRGSALPEATVVPGLPLGLSGLGGAVGSLVEVALEPGDGVLFYTDGVVETRNPDGDHFGDDRLRDLLAREHLSGGSPQEVVRRLIRSTLTHSNSRLRDDATMLYLRWHADHDGI